MNVGQLASFILCIMCYLLIERRNFAKTNTVNKYLGIGICSAAFLIWAYLSSFLPTVYPSALLEQLEPLVPFEPINVFREG
ncbi:hypothetical protein [Paenibacillus nanensis]|uniref:hypothetical protein n=1 Tax=Paenibacillus nanensis TaxID=393251 RepID=UPI0013C3008F|nr:hypothetical protein [Paenibacillus nanensis]